MNDNYLKDNIKRCVDYVMSKNDDDKRRIITGLFRFSDYLVNEQLVVQALNDEEKREWFNDDISKVCDSLQDRIDKAIEYIESKEEEEHINDYDEHYMDDYLDDYDEHLLDILKGSDKE